MKNTKYPFIKSGVYSTTELSKLLGHRSAISRMVEKELLQEVCRGIFSTSDIPITKAPYVYLKKKYGPQAVISGASAIFYHDLHERMDDKMDIDIVSNKSRKLETNLFYINNISSKRLVGVEEKTIQSVKVQIYSQERCIFEAFKISGFGEYFQKVIYNYLSQGGSNFQKIIELGKALGGKNKDVINYVIFLNNFMKGNLSL